METATLGFSPIEHDKLSERVAARLEESILGEHLPGGQALPPERELALQFRVSRTVIREALNLLKARGLVELRHGVGVFVAEKSAGSAADVLRVLLRRAEVSIEDLLELRSVLERETVKLAARRATPEEVARIGEILEEMKGLHDVPDRFAKRDLDFHLALVEASHNAAMKAILTVVHDILRPTIAWRGDTEKAQKGHEMIHSAIRERDEVASEDSMIRHLEQVRQDIAGHTPRRRQAREL